ncbi:hypothetical protein PTKIN_Ptkin07bG0061100 [Pterospermum kingtungense]
MGDLLGSYSGCMRVRTKHAGKDSWWFVRPVVNPISGSGGTPGPGPGGLGSGCYIMVSERPCDRECACGQEKGSAQGTT